MATPRSPSRRKSTMARRVLTSPLQLLEVMPNQELRVKGEALAFIRTLPKPLYLITVAGVAREGKSAFLSMMMRMLQGDMSTERCKLHFDVSTGVQSHSEGAWIWGAAGFRGVNGQKQTGSILLIDTQGLAKGKAEGLNRLFTMSALISSVMVLNVMRHFNDDAVNKLTVLTALSKMVSGCTPSRFPHLCVLIRDFELSLEDTGYSDLNAWLEAVVNGTHDRATSPVARSEISARRTIREMFPKRTMLSLEPPDKPDQQFLRSLAAQDDAKIEPGLPPEGDFRNDLVRVAREIEQLALERPACGPFGEKPINGDTLADLMQALIKDLNGTQIDLMSAAAMIKAGAATRVLTKLRQRLDREVENLECQLPLSVHDLQTLLDMVLQEETDAFNEGLADQGVKEEDLIQHRAKLETYVEDRKKYLAEKNEKETIRLLEEQYRIHSRLLEEKLADLAQDKQKTKDIKIYKEAHCKICKHEKQEFKTKTYFAAAETRATYLQDLQAIDLKYMTKRRLALGLPEEEDEEDLPERKQSPPKVRQNMAPAKPRVMDSRPSHMDEWKHDNHLETQKKSENCQCGIL